MLIFHSKSSAFLKFFCLFEAKRPRRGAGCARCIVGSPLICMEAGRDRSVSAAVPSYPGRACARRRARPRAAADRRRKMAAER